MQQEPHKMNVHISYTALVKLPIIFYVSLLQDFPLNTMALSIELTY